MYRGTLIEELIESVERAEIHASGEGLAGNIQRLEQQDTPVNVHVACNQQIRIVEVA